MDSNELELNTDQMAVSKRKRDSEECPSDSAESETEELPLAPRAPLQGEDIIHQTTFVYQEDDEEAERLRSNPNSPPGI
jgi:hypothetical protein